MEETLKKIILQLRDRFIQELENQQHILTGRLSGSFEYKIEPSGFGDWITSLFMDEYGIYVDQGVRAERVPFNRGSGAGDSKYIDGLIQFWKDRGVADPVRAAFALANVHKKEGIPTNASRTIANNRLGFITNNLEKNVTELSVMLETGFETFVDELFTNMATRINQQNN